MATYAIHSVLLQSMVNDSTSALPAYDLQGGVTGELSFGEYAKLEVQFNKTSGGNIANGKRFVFNPILFASSAFSTPFQLGFGWVVDVVTYTGLGTFDVYLRAGGTLPEITQRNVKLLVERVSNTRIKFTLFFYASQDVFTYINGIPRSNNLTLLSAAVGSSNLNNSTISAYRNAVSYLEFLIYEGDLNFVPIGTGDPYVRNPAAPTQKSCAYDIGARFLDDGIGATNTWLSGALIENSMMNFSSSVGGYKFAEFTRKAEPYLSNFHDYNFEVSTFDGSAAALVKDEQNELSISLRRKSGFTPSKIVARLWRTDALPSAQPFYVEYDIKTVDLPAANATPYPNAISSEPVFSTPANWSTTLTAININFSINGTALVSDGEYRIWLGVYDSAGGKSSSHLSNPMRVVTDGRGGGALLSITGLIQTFEYQYAGNNVQMAMFQRFSAGINLNSATYTGGTPAFLAQLKSIACQYVDTANNQVLASARYDFAAQQSISAPAITQIVSGADYFYAVELRVPFSAVPAPSDTEIRWVVTFRTPNANGTVNEVSVTPLQTVRRRAVDLVEILAIKYLDYAEYSIGNKVFVDTLCSGVDLYVVEVEIANNPPEKNITALLIYANNDGTNTILEENGFSPTYLLQLSTDAFESVPPDFGGNFFAYFTLDISQIPSRAQDVAIGIILEEI
jgi:hypothetical protein